MKTAIILHGMPDKEEYYNPANPTQSNRHWLPWLQKQFILKDILAQTPEMPEPYKPDYAKWCSIFERFDIDKDTLLVGHSCGGGFLVRWLSENKVQAGRVVLVAPWIDPERTNTTDFFDFKTDPALVERTNGLTILISDKDYPDVHTSVDLITHALPKANLVTIPGLGHFTSTDMKTEQFPQLLEACLES